MKKTFRSKAAKNIIYENDDLKNKESEKEKKAFAFMTPSCLMSC